MCSDVEYKIIPCLAGVGTVSALVGSVLQMDSHMVPKQKQVANMIEVRKIFCENMYGKCIICYES